jgi:hypothetical protein
MCFVGSDFKTPIQTSLMRQDLMSLVAGIKTIIFPNRKVWQGYAFIVLHTEHALNQLLERKTVKLPLTKLTVQLKPHNPSRTEKNNCQTPSEIQITSVFAAILEGVEPKFKNNYFLKQSEEFQGLKFIGEKNTDFGQTRRQILFVFESKTDRDSFLNDQDLIFKDYLKNKKLSRLRLVENSENLELTEFEKIWEK